MESRNTNPLPADDPLLGRVVAGKYRVHSMLAKGGMGRIYRAEQLPLGRIVALKILHPAPGAEDSDPQFQRRFLREAATCARLSHPNTVTVFDYGALEEGSDIFFMVMELVDGRTLQRVLKEEGRLSPPRALRVAREVARSLREAHDLGVVHRDLKPGNVMLVQTREGEQVKVLDFGIAKVLDAGAENITLEDRMVGSPRYMAPEQIQQRPVDARADVYALGTVLYEMLCGQTPFGGPVPVQTLVAHLQQAVPPLRDKVDVSPEVEALVLRCLAKQPDDRFPSVDAFLQALGQLEGALDPSDVGRAPDVDHETLVQPALTPGKGTIAMLGAALGGALLLSFLAAAVAFWKVLAPGGPLDAAPTPGDVGEPSSAPAPPEALTAPEEIAPAELPADAAAPVAAPIAVRSEPTGARVLVGGVEVGPTPLSYTPPPGDDPVVLRFELEGHEPVELTWSRGADEPVARLVAVEREAVRPAKTAPAPKKPVEAPPDLDILIER